MENKQNHWLEFQANNSPSVNIPGIIKTADCLPGRPFNLSEGLGRIEREKAAKSNEDE